jgi:hypothetical protein
MTELRRKIEIVLQQIEDEKASRLPHSQAHTKVDRASLQDDPNYTIRHYVDSACSVLSEPSDRSLPSIQVSSFLGSEDGTIAMSVEATTTDRPPKSFEVYLKGVPTCGPLSLQIDENQTLESFKNCIRLKLSLPNSSFSLMYGNKALDLPESTLESYGVSPYSTLLCMAFRPHRKDPGACTAWYARHRSQSAFVASIDEIVVETPEPKERVDEDPVQISELLETETLEREPIPSIPQARTVDVQGLQILFNPVDNGLTVIQCTELESNYHY